MIAPDQLSFLPEEPKFQPPAARRTDPDTSHIAARNAAPRAVTGRLLVLRHLRKGAMTDFELAAVANLQQTSIGVRRGECVKAGWVEAALDHAGKPLTRLSPSGSPARVWKITDAGLEFYKNRRRAR